MKHRSFCQLLFALIIAAIAVMSFVQQSIQSANAQSNPISNLSVKDTANGSSWSIQSNLQVGNLSYGDRLPPTYTPGYSFTVIPSTLVGAAWIRTADASKNYTGTPLVTFNISGAANVYVGLDDRATKPAWLDTTWTDAFASGLSIIEAGGSGLTRTFSVYRKTFAVGVVSLGSLSGGSINAYTVIVVPTNSSSTPTFTPTFVPTQATATPTKSPVPGTGTTAWKNAKFNIDVANVVRQSNIILGHANTAAQDSMPVGNGILGAAVWSASGLTAQLNRVDTFPDRKSPGQVVISGLSKLTGASDYKGSVDLYNAMFNESGGGMTASAYILQNKDEMIIDVTGADPNTTQTAQVKLWTGRSPTISTSGAVATMSETWVDNVGTGASGQTFGALAGLTAGGRNVKASKVDSLTIQVSFNPNTDGSFRVIIAAPTWTGGNAMTTTTALIGSDATASQTSLQSAHLTWWHNYWAKVGLIKMSSSDGNAAYIQNLRDIDLYTVAAYSGGKVPGSHAGVADLFAWNQDTQRWFASGYWHWNLRMQVGANLGAGVPEFNLPYFNLYTSNLANIETWTQQQMSGTGSNACVPETMRFNGNGYYGPPREVINASCYSSNAATYNARTLSTGAEVSLWVWQQYQYTGDLNFLTANYPLMAASARFLLDHATKGSDGKLHTNPSNAHETQWDVHDPVTDIAAMQALFPVVIKAAQLLNRDSSLVTQLQTAIPEILPFPRTDTATKTKLLSPSDDAAGQDMIGLSYVPTATLHNSENLGLETVWPYNLISDNSGSLTQLANRTFTSRVNVVHNDWSYDPIQAARLDRAADFQSTVLSLPQKYQTWVDGMANVFAKTTDQTPYGEMVGVIADGVQEALVQDYDGLLRIAPAWPTDWDVSGSVFIQGNSKVDVQMESGKLVTVVIEAKSSSTIQIRNPWSGQSVQVVDETGAMIVSPTTAGQFAIPVTAGHAYLVELVSNPTTSLTFAQVTGKPATAPRTLGTVKIGLP